ncbi:MAG: N-acetyltransferase [Planctomycetota bacterium]|nr:MAG: N-acetyltransferase [Planctomycetota bacterium]
MSIAYFKRFRMEMDLRHALPQPELPPGYAWAGWHPSLCDQHATVKFQSFQGEPDSELFPCLGQREGCQSLMADIARHPAFVPQVTWLVRFVANEFTGPIPVGTIQGLMASRLAGAIQNIGVCPLHRGTGLGRALLLKCLAGFQATGMRRVALEVTADNDRAVGLYRSLGFQVTKTSYRALEQPDLLPV